MRRRDSHLSVERLWRKHTDPDGRTSRNDVPDTDPDGSCVHSGECIEECIVDEPYGQDGETDG